METPEVFLMYRHLLDILSEQKSLEKLLYVVSEDGSMRQIIDALQQMEEDPKKKPEKEFVKKFKDLIQSLDKEAEDDEIAPKPMKGAEGTAPITGKTFGQALDLLIAHDNPYSSMTRYYYPELEGSKEFKDYRVKIMSPEHFKSFLVEKEGDKFVPYIPSQEDMLANDWVVLAE